ncbi:endochitinase-like isoform X2 [Dermacentor variabilis]|uniref:endochitinase-like isoform X2 n=1 Tax=Dermacentor variabilis TaxID=34621 RepID=UPI003F5C47FF
MEPQTIISCFKTWITVLCFLLLGFFRPSGAVFIENFSHGRILPVVCYYEKGQAFRPFPMNYGMEDVRGNLCSHVNLAYIELNETTGTIKLDPTINFTEFAQLKNKFPRLKTLLSIGGWSNQTQVISAMATTMTRRRVFINDAVRKLVDNGFDGLDVFWLFPGMVDRGGNRRDKVNFVRLLKELYAAFKGRKLLLTAGVPINQNVLDAGYDIPAIDRYLDWMNIIGYDLRGYWNVRTDIHSPLHPRTIDGPDVSELNVICKNIKFGTWRRSFDAEGMCPYATDGKDWVGYEDAESISKKVEFVRKEGYAGIMVLSCDMDDFRGVCGTQNILLQTINDAIPRLRYNVI